MKTTTTTREYDAKGKLTKETIVEHDTGTAYQPVTVACTCYGGIVQTWCPLHSGRTINTPYQVWCTSSDTASLTATSPN